MGSNKTFGVLVFYAVVVTASLLILLVRAPRVGSRGILKAAEVEAMGRTLGALVERTRVAAPGARRPPSIHWTFGEDCHDFRGLMTFPLADGSETQFWVRLDPEPRRKLRNPARIPLPGLTLRRDEQRSDLVPALHPGRGWLAVRFDPSEEGGADPPRQLLINNFRGGGAMPAAAAVGRELEALTTQQECPISPRDTMAMDLLLGLLRLSVCDLEGKRECHASYLTLYRGLVPDVYRLDGGALEQDCGRLALRVSMERDFGGEDSRVLFEVLAQETQVTCGVLLEAVRPTPAGQRPPRVRILAQRPDGGGLRGYLPLESLLEGTAWR